MTFIYIYINSCSTWFQLWMTMHLCNLNTFAVYTSICFPDHMYELVPNCCPCTFVPASAVFVTLNICNMISLPLYPYTFTCLHLDCDIDYLCFTYIWHFPSCLIFVHIYLAFSIIFDLTSHIFDFFHHIWSLAIWIWLCSINLPSFYIYIAMSPSCLISVHIYMAVFPSCPICVHKYMVVFINLISVHIYVTGIHTIWYQHMPLFHW